jgi:hypothetical protein
MYLHTYLPAHHTIVAMYIAACAKHGFGYTPQACCDAPLACQASICTTSNSGTLCGSQPQSLRPPGRCLRCCPFLLSCCTPPAACRAPPAAVPGPSLSPAQQGRQRQRHQTARGSTRSPRGPGGAPAWRAHPGRQQQPGSARGSTAKTTHDFSPHPALAQSSCARPPHRAHMFNTIYPEVCESQCYTAVNVLLRAKRCAPC